jgi:hypothetical protein
LVRVRLGQDAGSLGLVNMARLGHGWGSWLGWVRVRLATKG